MQINLRHPRILREYNWLEKLYCKLFKIQATQFEWTWMFFKLKHTVYSAYEYKTHVHIVNEWS